MELKELEDLIKYHNDKYTNGTPEISDSEYDLLIDELRKKDPENDLLTTVGAPIPSYGQKIKHFSVMGSLMKIQNSIKALNDWYNKYPSDAYIWSDKLDGCSGELHYINGILIGAATRGDGLTGMNIIDAVKMIDGLPTKINCNEELIIRGEFIIPLNFFENNLKNKFANPRNAVSGTLMSKDPKDLINKGLKFIVHRVMNKDNLKSLTEEEYFINGICGVDYKKESCWLKYVELHEGKLTQEIIDEYIKSKRSNLNYLIDGIVVAISSTKVRENLGFLGSDKKYPKSIIAFKFAPDTAETTLIGVEWSVGRNGEVYPTGLLEPIDLSGCVISRASLYNYDKITKLGAKIGSKVQICKSGDIIPVITQILNNDGERIIFPIACPICNNVLIKDDKHMWCTNINCKGRLIQRIVHHLTILSVKDVGEKIIEKLYDSGKLNKLSDIYRVTEDDIITLDRSGIKTAKNFKDSLNKILEIPLNIFLCSLGIPSIGNTISKLLVKQYSTMENIFKCTEQELIKIEGIGNILAKDIIVGLQKNKELIEELYNKILKVKKYEDKIGKFKGITFCCTGELSFPRKQLQKIIEDNAGEYSSIKKGLQYLLIGEKAVSEKIEKAKKLGSKIITEDEFNGMLKN
jgi:DNA ligase (NAD+)